MDKSDDSEEGLNAQEKELLGLPSPSSSFGSSLGTSQEFQKLLKPPNKKKYEEEMETINQDIKNREAELKSLGAWSPGGGPSSLESIRKEKEDNIYKRKCVDAELKQLNLNIQKLRGSLSATESNLHLKNEAKIDEAIRKLEYQLKVQNFKLSEERKIVAEIDRLKRSKKALVQYFAQKREFDDVKAKQTRLRGEREHLYKSVTTLKNKEDDIRKSRQTSKAKSEELKKELDELYDRKRKLFSDFKQHEADFYRLQKEHKKAQRKESFKKREEEKRAKEMAYRKEMLEFESQKEPFEDEKNLCNTLMSYLQRHISSSSEGMDLASPREEQPDLSTAVAAPSVADSLDDGMFVLLKKSDDTESDYSISNKRANSRRSRKGRKTSVTKPLAHTPQIIAQFASLNLNAPSNVSEIPASLEQLQARKRYYDEHAPTVQRPILGSLSGSFSSSGSITSSLESPMRERSSTWGFVEVPPPIMENQTQSDCGRSAESGFHDMSRQASKTESSESAADSHSLDHALDELIEQSAEYEERDSRSSSDTVTPDDHITEDVEHAGSHERRQFSPRDGFLKTSNQSLSHDTGKNQIISHDNDSAVFEMGSNSEESSNGGSSCVMLLNTQSSYDRDFPATLNVNSFKTGKSLTFPGEPNQMLLPGNRSPVAEMKLPSNQSNTTRLPSNKYNEILMPVNQMATQHPGDAEIVSDDCLASNSDAHVPTTGSDATSCIPVAESDTKSSDVTVSDSDCNEDVSFHTGNQNLYSHKSATERYSEKTICEPVPGVLNEPDSFKANDDIANKLVTFSDKLKGIETNSEQEAYLLCDRKKKCDKTFSADSRQHCDGIVDAEDGEKDGAGLECIAGAGISCVEGASGFDDSLGASGIDSDTEPSKHALDTLVGEETSI